MKQLAYRFLRWLSSPFCWHNAQTFRRNIYGDEINLTGARSVWTCLDCGRLIYRPYLLEETSGLCYLVKPE